MIVKQLSVFLENKKGSLSEITNVLSENGINLRAIYIAETSDYGIVRLIADDNRRAAMILSGEGYVVSPTDVCVIKVPDVPGGLNSVLKILNENDIEIEYMYSVFGIEDNQASIVFRVSYPEMVNKLLEK